ncbi:Leucine-rich repeat-containing protein 47-like, partial [Homarus americanus]
QQALDEKRYELVLSGDDINKKIEDEGLDPGLYELSHLNFLRVSKSPLVTISEDIGKLRNLTNLILPGNKIQTLPETIGNLEKMKLLDISINCLQSLPNGIDLNLKGNPLNDRRFRKLVESDRCLPRQVIDYIRQHCPRSENSKGGAPGKGKKGKGGKGKAKDEDEVDILCNELRVLSVKDTVPVVQVTTAAKDVRPYIVCCVLQGVDLSGDNLKKFISTQTKLHEGVCEKRLAATIATHDLAKIKGPLKFIAGAPEEIRIHPLVRGKEMSARELHVGLQQEAEAQRKHQKRNNITGLHKFLHLVDRWSLWPCLVDADGTVISLPPLTNAENTKITQETVNVFVEVTSSTSLGKAKEVIDSLILFSLQTGISPEKNAGGKDVLTIQQVRVVDEDGGLRVLYPSRTDLVFKNEKVRVVMPDK